MASSAVANAALIQSLKRARARQPNPAIRSGSRASSRDPSRSKGSPSAAETMSIASISERRPVPSKVDTRPPWNGSTVINNNKPPKSVFLDATSTENRPPTSTMGRPLTSDETSVPVKVVHVTPSMIESGTNNYTRNPVTPSTYSSNSKLIRTDPDVVVLESETSKRSWRNCFRKNKKYSSKPSSDTEALLNAQKSPVYRACQCCASGRVASRCPSCYFCELFYGCPLYCWLLTLLLLLLPMLILFGWLLSEQPALNPAKRQYVTQQSSVVQNDVYAVMRNCAVPYCTNPSPATTINQLYLTYHDYAVTQVTSSAYSLDSFTPIILFILTLVMHRY